MERDQIEAEARALLSEMWVERERLWPNSQPSVIQMLDPGVAAQVLGVRYEEVDTLESPFGFRGSHHRVAGLIDRQESKIVVATSFPVETVRFTAAHEIGHWILHKGEVMHRDRPISGPRLSYEPRDRHEREADHFAACLLMPAKLVRAQFEALFGPAPFRFDDNAAFYLNAADPDSLLRAEHDSLDREFALACCTTFAGKHFYSLAEQFRVSKSAMAIRLKELRLISWP